MKKSFTKNLTLVFLLFCALQLKSQDIHFSQIGNSPMNISPALTGVFSGDVRAVANYKSQWSSVPVPFTTFSGSYEMKFSNKKFPNSLFGGGIIFNHDQAGHGELSLSQLGLNAAYTHQVAKRAFITGGFQFSVAQRMFKPQQLSFDSQFNGELFDGGMDSGEFFEDPSFVFFNLSTGLNLHLQNPEKRFRADIGGSVFNINEASQSFFSNNDIRLKRRIHLHGISSFMVGEKVDLYLLGIVSMQDPYTETVIGTGLKFYVSNTLSKELAVQLGVNYRVEDAIIPNIEIEFRNTYKLAISYDVNTSSFTQATNGKGSPEVSFIYSLKKVEPLEKTKICPLY